MSTAVPHRTIINWELLRREVALVLTRQPGWLVFGLMPPLGIALYTLLRHWTPERAARDLLQAALFLAAWNIIFPTIYIAIDWLQTKQDAAEVEQQHLPLGAAHFALRRLVIIDLVPLTSALLGGLVWVALLLYYQWPYGQDFDPYGGWIWDVSYSGHMLTSPWWPEVTWIIVSILSGTLLVIAFGFALELLAPNRFLRGVLLLALPAGLYWFEKKLVGYDSYGGPAYYYPGGMGHGWMTMNYHQSRGESLWPYVVLLVVLLATPLIYALAAPGLRVALVLVPIVLAAAFAVRPMVPEEIKEHIRPVSSMLAGRDTRYAGALLLGHLSPPENVRLLAYSFPSNVLFHWWSKVPSPGPAPEYPELPPEPPYPSTSDKSAPEYVKWQAAEDAWQQQTKPQTDAYQKASEAWDKADSAYEDQKKHWPRAYMWLTAGFYPFLFPLWALAGMLLGVHLRADRSPFRVREPKPRRR